MKLELDLMELNSLYVAVSHQLDRAKSDAMEYPSDYFQNELVRVEKLVEKVQDALYAECKVIDDMVAEYRMKAGISMINEK
jgi:hypothetical protein